MFFTQLEAGMTSSSAANKGNGRTRTSGSHVMMQVHPGM